MANTKNEIQEKTVEERFEELDGIIEKLEDNTTGLDESFALYEQGMKLIRSVHGSIERVEEKMRVLESEAGE